MKQLAILYFIFQFIILGSCHGKQVKAVFEKEDQKKEFMINTSLKREINRLIHPFNESDKLFIDIFFSNRNDTNMLVILIDLRLPIVCNQSAILGYGKYEKDDWVMISAYDVADSIIQKFIRKDDLLPFIDSIDLEYDPELPLYDPKATYFLIQGDSLIYKETRKW